MKHVAIKGMVLLCIVLVSPVIGAENHRRENHKQCGRKSGAWLLFVASVALMSNAWSTAGVDQRCLQDMCVKKFMFIPQQICSGSGFCFNVPLGFAAGACLGAAVTDTLINN